MILQPEPFFNAVEHLRKEDPEPGHVILLSPGGKIFSQEKAEQLVQKKRLILLCGHYEGVDERVREVLVDEELSLGDYILTGGEIPAMAVADAVIRLLPGVLAPESRSEESFSGNLLEYPQYTRPADFRGLKVPEVLLSGNHGKIKEWRRRKSLLRTLLNRPDLLKKARLTAEEKKYLLEEARSREIDILL